MDPTKTPLTTQLERCGGKSLAQTLGIPFYNLPVGLVDSHPFEIWFPYIFPIKLTRFFFGRYRFLLQARLLSRRKSLRSSSLQRLLRSMMVTPWRRSTSR